MTALRDRLARARREEGLTLIEVVVAMMILALVSTSVIYGMLQVLTLTRDSRARQVAANLAAEEVDLARDTVDLFTLLDRERTVLLNGDRFTVHRATQWVSDPAAELRCGAGGTGLRYKRVLVTVTWSAMRAGTAPVQSVTVLNPEAKVNDPTKGTILVSVLGASGTGRSGVTVTATPSTSVSPNTAQPLTRAPALTDPQGCSYVLMVTPGVYDVTVTRTGYVDTQQAASSTETVGVAEATSVPVVFELEERATIDAELGAGHVAAPGETVWAPDDVAMTLASSYAPSGAFSPAPATRTGRSLRLHVYPFASGYEVFAGTCSAADPAAWPPLTEAGRTFTGHRDPGVAVAPGSVVLAPVRTGVVTVDLGPASDSSPRFVRAVSAANSDVPGHPGCEPTTLDFVGTADRPVPADGRLTLALPFGSWELSHGTVGSALEPSPLAGTQLTFPALAERPVRSSVSPAGTVTFDPREVGA